MSIAKYRKEGHEGWWLTDFTMEQVEGRLNDLENRCMQLQAEVVAKEERHNWQVENMVKMVDEATAKEHAETERLKQWVNDLQSGMYINCVYCGHRYGPKDKVPSTMADALKEHIEKCPKHPMSALKKENDDLRKMLEGVMGGDNRAVDAAVAYLNATRKG